MELVFFTPPGGAVFVRWICYLHHEFRVFDDFGNCRTARRCNFLWMSFSFCTAIFVILVTFVIIGPPGGVIFHVLCLFWWPKKQFF
jgi:hypothetical protein